MKTVQVLIAESWGLLDLAAIPAPSHRNRTMTDWAARMERAKVMLADAQKIAMERDWVMWRPAHDGREMPANGVPVLAVVQIGQNRHVVRATYIRSGQVEADLDYDEAYEYDEETDTYWLSPGWYEHNLVEEIHWQISEPVTHWAPLPSLPEVAR